MLLSLPPRGTERSSGRRFWSRVAPHGESLSKRSVSHRSPGGKDCGRRRRWRSRRPLLPAGAVREEPHRPPGGELGRHTPIGGEADLRPHARKAVDAPRHIAVESESVDGVMGAPCQRVLSSSRRAPRSRGPRPPRRRKRSTWTSLTLAGVSCCQAVASSKRHTPALGISTATIPKPLIAMASASAVVSCRQPVPSSSRHTPQPGISAATSPRASTATCDASEPVDCCQPAASVKRHTP